MLVGVRDPDPALRIGFETIGEAQQRQGRTQPHAEVAPQVEVGPEVGAQRLAGLAVDPVRRDGQIGPLPLRPGAPVGQIQRPARGGHGKAAGPLA
mgnify:CR=1 FL=1